MTTKLDKILEEKGVSKSDFEDIISVFTECLIDNSVQIVPDDRVQYPPGFFKPEGGQKYYLIDHDDANVIILNSFWKGIDRNDKHRLSLGNCYKTEAGAQHALDQRLAYCELVRKIAELNHREGWEVDWSDKSQLKMYFILPKKHDSEIETDGFCLRMDTRPELYFSPELSDELIETIGVKKIKLALWSLT